MIALTIYKALNIAEDKVSDNMKEKNNITSPILYGLIIIAGIIFIYQVLSVAGVGASSFSSSASGGVGPYSKLSMNGQGYNQLLQWDSSIILTAAEKSQYAGFDVLIPCCAFRMTTENETDDCRCGHHVAFAGLIKYGITHGWSRQQIQEEINAWKPVFYPQCLSSKALCDL